MLDGLDTCNQGTADVLVLVVHDLLSGLLDLRKWVLVVEVEGLLEVVSELSGWQ